MKEQPRIPALEQHWFDLSNKRRLFWIFQGCGWFGTSVIAAAVLRSHAGALLPFIVFRALFGLVITSFLLRPLLRRVRRRRALSVSAGIPVVLVGALALGAADSHAMSIGLSRSLASSSIPTEALELYLDSGTLLRTLAYGCWLALYFGINYFIETSRDRLRLALLESETRESELRRLRAQVNPHFLFNALNSIIAEAERPERVIAITHLLADFLRFSLAQDGNMHPLGEELDVLESYLQVEKIRFEQRFEYTLVVDPAVRLQRVPCALVQPLLENAVKYGMRTSPRPLRVVVRARLGAGHLLLEVENSGHWVAAGTGTSTGIGLLNLRRRLALLYDNRATVEPVLTSGWVTLRVTLPLSPPADLPHPPAPLAAP
jgi:hypothetical protein